MEFNKVFDFYDQTYLKSYNLDRAIQYQLNLLDSLDVFTREHSENVATITCNLCKKLHCSKGFTEYCVTLGYKLCLKDTKLRPYYAGVYYHHEALDGTGYPQGLTKEDIPYEAQIIRVADEYDALVSKRQYKTHVGISDALKIIIDNTKPSNNNKLC